MAELTPEQRRLGKCVAGQDWAEGTWQRAVHTLLMAYDERESQLAAARVDAERYRKLRSFLAANYVAPWEVKVWQLPKQHGEGGRWLWCTAELMDQRLDAARAASGTGAPGDST
jgi:hypothetical protein